VLEGGTMKSPVIKRSISIDGHKTSVSLEDAFWSCLTEIGRRKVRRCRRRLQKSTGAPRVQPVLRDPPVCTRPGLLTKSGGHRGETAAPKMSRQFWGIGTGG
jgi:hypothetical protein